MAARRCRPESGAILIRFDRPRFPTVHFRARNDSDYSKLRVALDRFAESWLRKRGVVEARRG